MSIVPNPCLVGLGTIVFWGLLGVIFLKIDIFYTFLC